MKSLLNFTATAALAKTSQACSIGLRFAIAAMLFPTAALAEPPVSDEKNDISENPKAALVAIGSEVDSLPEQAKLPLLEPLSAPTGLAVELLQPSWSAEIELNQAQAEVEPELETEPELEAATAIAPESAPEPAVEKPIAEALVPLYETLQSEAMLLQAPSTVLTTDAIAQATESDSASEDADTAESLTSNFFIKPQVDFSRTILDWQETVTGKPKAILEMGEAGIIPETGIVLSGAYWASQMYEYSNTAGKFPILSRFPSQHNNRSKSGQEFIINNAALGITGRLADWGTVYLQPEYTEIEFPGQEEWQWRKAFVMVGNLDKFPLYAYYGRNTVDFGWMDGYNPFTHSVNNHFYRVDSDEAVLGLGYAQGGLHVIGTAIPSGRQLRVADTSNSDGWDNFSVNASYDIPLGQATDLTLGGGYLHSTIYNRVIAHHPGPTFAQALANGDEPKRNGAYDLFAELQWEDLRAGVEYTSSLKKWPATDAKVQALTVQGAYDFDIGDVPLTLSAVYGLGLQGPDDEEYERLSQLAIGLEADIADYVTFAFEYVRNDGFVPLVAITRASDRDVTTNTYILGMKLRF